MVDTIKFSQMTSGGDIENDDKTPGLKAGANVLFNNPWTFLKPGTTADRPTPSSTINYRMRLNTDLSLYEYYDPVAVDWIQIQQSTTTPLSIQGTANQVLANGTSGTPITGTAVVLTLPQDIGLSSGVTFGSLTLGTPLTGANGGTGVNNGSATITIGDDVSFLGAFTFAGTLTGNTTVTFPTSGTLATTSQIPTGAALTRVDDTNVTLTLGGSPSTALVNAASLTLGWTGTLSGTRGGTGVNNGASTFTIGGNTSFVGAFTFAGTLTNNTAVTFPTSGTLATTSQLPTPAALTKVDDTNVTLTLGGTPSTALLQATSLTLGWTGTLAIARGGTGVGSVTTSPTASAFAGWDANSNLSANNFLAGYATTVTAAGTTTLTVASPYLQFFTGATTQTVQMPVTSTLVLGQSWFITNTSSGNVTINSSGGNAILVMGANTSALVSCILTSGTTAASWYASYLGGSGTGIVNSGTANQLAYYASSGNAVSGLTGANGGVLITNSTGVPSWLANPTANNRILLSVSGDASAWSAYTMAAPGSSGNIPQSDGTNWTSVAPGVALSYVKQVVQTVDQTNRSTTSASMTSSGVSVSITPTSNTSRILLFFTAMTGNSTAGASANRFAFFRSTTDLTPAGNTEFAVGYLTNNPVIIPVSMSYIDSPATTSPTTYNIYWLTAGGTAYLGRRGLDTAYDSPNVLTAIEIAA